MPFLRFARDKRGYETTALVHAYRGRQGRARQKVLYWFRTPPNVKVGRPALDQEAIRWIEEHNPDIEFDWPKILETSPGSAAAPEDAGGRRQRRIRSDRPLERSGRPDSRSPQRAAAPELQPAAEAMLPAVAAVPDPSLAETGQAPFEEEALEQIAHPDAEGPPEATFSAVESILGREQLIRFRARYAELQARIIERGEPARVEIMRAQAEALNPDTWVTVEEVRKGLEEFEPKIRELRAALGLKRRRRSRRGGRRRHAGDRQTGSVGVASNSPDSGPVSNQPGVDAQDAESEDEGDGGDLV